MTAILIRLTDGKKLHREEVEFIPGPIQGEDMGFLRAYEQDAKRYDWTVEECKTYLETGSRQRRVSDSPPIEFPPVDPGDRSSESERDFDWDSAEGVQFEKNPIGEK